MASLGKGLAKAWQGKSLPDGSLNRDARGDGIHTADLENGDMVQIGGAQATASSASPPAGVLPPPFPHRFPCACLEHQRRHLDGGSGDGTVGGTSGASASGASGGDEGATVSSSERPFSNPSFGALQHTTIYHNRNSP